MVTATAPIGNPYDNWKLRLAGELTSFDPNKPDPGLYRMRVTRKSTGEKYFDLVHIREVIDKETGEITYVADVGKDQPFSGPAMAIWSRCAPNPISTEKATAYKKTGIWFDAVNEPANLGDVATGPTSQPGDAFADQEALHRLVTSANLWRAANMVIEKQDQADHAANFAAAAGRLEDKLEAWLDADTKEAKSIISIAHGKWNPLIKQAAGLKREIKETWIFPFFEAEAKRREGQETPRGQIETPIAAGSSESRKTTWTTRSNVVLNDPRAFLRWLVERNEDVPPPLVDACEKEARRMMREGHKEGEVPGVSVEMKTVVS